MNIERLLNWSAPTSRVTARGPREIYTASPTAAFWVLWREQKEVLKAAGVTCKPGEDGWEVIWFRDLSSTASLELVDRPATVRTVERPQAPVVADEAPAKANWTWSPEQVAIFDDFATPAGNVVVRARAGTGKTTVIEHGFSKAPEANILYAVFGKKNQVEAQTKIRDSRVTISTWNALGFRIVKSVWGADVKPDDGVELDRINAAFGGEVPDDAFAAVKKLVAISKCVCPFVPSLAQLETLVIEWDILGDLESETEENVWPAARIAKVALAALKMALERDSQGRISFADQCWLPVVMGWVHPCFDLVVVDEAQDTNAVQLAIARAIVTKEGRTFVVGDDRQAIYRFRGAAEDGLGEMKVILSAVERGLTVTRRCPKAVVALASKIVLDYKAADDAPEGMVDTILSSRVFEQVRPGDAILSRSNAPLMPICLGLLRAGIPARIEGKDIGKALMTLVGKLKAKSIPDFLKRLDNWQRKQVKRAEQTRDKEARIGAINDQFETLLALASDMSSVGALLARISALFTNSENDPRPMVVCSTAHKGKGLEWNRVFLLQGTFKNTEATTGEESNVYYVALTRAKKHLTFIV